MKHLFKTSLLALVAIAMAALSSCSSDDSKNSSEILNRVPADVEFVFVGNFDQLIKNAGFEITKNDIKGPKELKSELNSIDDKVREVIGALHSSIDCDHVVLMGYFSDEPNVAGMAKITDKKLLSKTLSDEFEIDCSEVKGMDVYELDRHDAYLVVKDSYAYVVFTWDDESAVSVAKKFINHAKDENITSIASVADVLTQDKILNVAVNANSLIKLMQKAQRYGYMDYETIIGLQTIMPNLKDSWLGINANYADAELSIESYLFDEKTGERKGYPGMEKVDPSVLKYLPANTIAAIATGIDNNTVQKSFNQLKELSGGDPMINELIDQLCNIDGTIAIGLGISNEQQLLDICIEEDPLKADITLVAQMRNHSNAEELKGCLVDIANKMGINTEDLGNAIKLTTASSFGLYLMVNDNNFIVSNKPYVDKNDNPTIKMFNNVSSGMVVNIPTISKLIGGQSKAGFEGSFIYQNNTFIFNLKLINAGNNIYSAIQDLACDWQNFSDKIEKALQEKYWSRGVPFEYDYDYDYSDSLYRDYDFD